MLVLSRISSFSTKIQILTKIRFFYLATPKMIQPTFRIVFEVLIYIGVGFQHECNGYFMITAFETACKISSEK
jgi:hypothetical protein